MIQSRIPAITERAPTTITIHTKPGIEPSYAYHAEAYAVPNLNATSPITRKNAPFATCLLFRFSPHPPLAVMFSAYSPLVIRDMTYANTRMPITTMTTFNVTRCASFHWINN